MRVCTVSTIDSIAHSRLFTFTHSLIRTILLICECVITKSLGEENKAIEHAFIAVDAIILFFDFCSPQMNKAVVFVMRFVYPANLYSMNWNCAVRFRSQGRQLGKHLITVDLIRFFMHCYCECNLMCECFYALGAICRIARTHTYTHVPYFLLTFEVIQK